MSTPTFRGTVRAAFSSGNAEYSDMVIKDRDGTSYHVHRNILCWQSPFFANAMKEGRFKEGSEKAITLLEEEPQVVKAMLEYLYGGDYSEVQMGLGAVGVLRFHINVYAIADKYCIADNGLANLACKYFNEATQANWNDIRNDFPQIIYEVYIKTTDRDRILRPTLIKIVKRNLTKLLGLAKFEVIADGLPGFSLALMKRVYNEFVDTTESPQEQAAMEGIRLDTFLCLCCLRNVVLYVNEQEPMAADTRIHYPLYRVKYS